MTRSKLYFLLASLLIISFLALAVSAIKSTRQEIQLKNVELSERGAELKKLKLQYDNLNVQLEDTDASNKQKIEQLEKEKAELDQERQRLERELQAKLERKRQEQLAVEARKSSLLNTLTGTKTASAASRPQGTKFDWMAQAGIPQSDWQYVDYIVMKESSWNPNAVNPNGGACGLAQSLPCGKQAVYGAWNDPVANLKWQYDYVRGRYGGYAGAHAFWLANSWY